MHDHMKFTIELSSPMAVYFPGQIVSGFVRAVLTKKESYRSISVKCEGKSEVEWSEQSTRSGSTNNEREIYSSSEQYFAQKQRLQGDETQTLELEAGDYRFPFQFLLPPQLPPSFEGVHGNVRYVVKAKMDRPWAFDYEFKKAFTVNVLIDLNLNNKVMEPVRNEDTKHICCLCCRSGPITARAWLDHTGFVPGETILFCGEVDNQSGRTLAASKLRLVEKSVFKAREKKKIEERTVHEVNRGAVQDGNSEVWDHVPLVVPPLAPSGLPGCNIIDIEYILEFVVDPAAFSFNLVVPIKITIGTVPLQSSFTKFQPLAPSAPPMTLVGPEGGSVSAPGGAGGFLPPMFPTQYPNLPPPRYEESRFNVDIRDKDDSQHMNQGYDTKYTPHYITYQGNM